MQHVEPLPGKYPDCFAEPQITWDDIKHGWCPERLRFEMDKRGMSARELSRVLRKHHKILQTPLMIYKMSRQNGRHVRHVPNATVWAALASIFDIAALDFLRARP